MVRPDSELSVLGQRSGATHADAPRIPSCWDCVGRGILFYYLSGGVVLMGGILGSSLLRKNINPGYVFDGGAGSFFVNWDGQWYKSIAQHGYNYNPYGQSSVAFFPAYPIISRLFSQSTGLGVEPSLVLVSNLSLCAAFILAARYFTERSGPDDAGAADYALLAMGLAPPTFFLRMAYTDSLFLLLVTLFLFGVRRGWPPLLLAMIVGFSTSVRASGVSLLPALCHQFWLRSSGLPQFTKKAIFILPLSVWGLLAFMSYLYLECGHPLAFSENQIYWNMYPHASITEKLSSLMSMRPFWCRFDPSSPGYWQRHDSIPFPAFSLYLADPIYFTSAIGLIILGAWKGWINSAEILVAAGLFATPMLLKCYETNMVGFGRYAATVLPVYLVLGKILRSLPPPVSASILALSGAMALIYTALFAGWYVLL